MAGLSCTMEITCYQHRTNTLDNACGATFTTMACSINCASWAVAEMQVLPCWKKKSLGRNPSDQLPSSD